MTSVDARALGKVIDELENARRRGVTGGVVVVGLAALVARTRGWEDRPDVPDSVEDVELVLACASTERDRLVVELDRAAVDVFPNAGNPSAAGEDSGDPSRTYGHGGRWYRLVTGVPTPVRWAGSFGGPLSVHIATEREVAAYAAGCLALAHEASPGHSARAHAGRVAARLERLGAGEVLAEAQALWGTAVFASARPGAVERLHQVAEELTAAGQ